jgi:Fe-S-cluster containining protein
LQYLAGEFLARPKTKSTKAVPQFKCTNCGVCCKGNDKGARKVSKDEYGIFYTLDPQARVLALWPWEAARLIKRASIMSIKANFKPLAFIVDKKDDQAVILMYFLDQGACPFLINSKCEVWHDRPFTCKEFPLYGHRTGIGLSSLCPDVVRPPLVDDEEENGRIIKAAYPKEIVYLFKDMDIYRMVFDFLRDLEKNHIIKWDKDAKVEEATLLIEDPNRRLDLSELILSNGIMSREQLDHLVEKLESVEDVDEHLELRISKKMVGM